MVLIQIFHADGSANRCNSSCYDASPHSACTCICEGRNHGHGFAFAAKNTIQHADRWLAKQRAAKAEESKQANEDQPSLF